MSHDGKTRSEKKMEAFREIVQIIDELETDDDKFTVLAMVQTWFAKLLDN